MEAEVTKAAQVLATKIGKLLDQELVRRAKNNESGQRTITILSFALLSTLNAIYDVMMKVPAEREQALELFWATFKAIRLEQDAAHAEPATTTTH